ncbi:AIPR protein [Arthrobacter sp. 49Tsu3.1M3]|uniref:AIPR family protein n=1 Tax=Arthrobacter sp. 49Tsu3.1M3 TaxID=1279029 RepID=UPI0009A710A7|nr:AIPR family protein [Arthrobacter sp. 49Tsu3.1M3]SKB73538.1 AIPR protein [Arthrobacter sp. 49Tsu3.1M3]
MNIEEFHLNLKSDVRVRAEAENDFAAGAFASLMAERLSDVEEVDSLQVLHYEGRGSNRQHLAIDGFDLDDTDGQISLAVVDWRDSEDIAVISTPDARKRLKALEYFLTESVQNFLEDALEESSAAHQLARDLRSRGRNVSRYRLYLLTDARTSDRMKDVVSSELNGVPIEYHIWDLQRLHQVQESNSGRSEIEIDLEEWLPLGLPVLKTTGKSDDFVTYLASVPGDVIADLYGQYGSRLLESNVRSYLSARGMVNKGIKKTALTEPEMFLAYNNGITATATAVSVDVASGMPVLRGIENLQIVNGGQTTASLYNLRKETSPKPDLSGIFVQMKLIVVDSAKAEEIVPDVARYANSQNKVSAADFFSNSPFHRRIEDHSRHVAAPALAGKSYNVYWYYERTRGQYLNEKSRGGATHAKMFESQHPKSQVMTKTDVAKFELSWQQKPHVVSQGAQKSFMAFAASVAETWERSESDFNELYFKNVVARAIMFNTIRADIANADWYEKGYLANIVTYTMAKIAREIEKQGRGYLMDFNAVWAQQSLPQPVRDFAVHVGSLVLGALNSPDRPVNNVTEWAKRAECWNLVQQIPVILPESLLNTLVSPARQIDRRRDAAATQKIDNGINATMRVLQISPADWSEAISYGQQHRALTEKEISVLRLVARPTPAVPTDRQSAVILGALQKIQDLGFAKI